ncbi:MAG: polya polymerase, partial [Deltaproteobacteria bacterium]|nr:polya polymerase [Deltaproteobacteria bacterium]
GLVKRPGLQLKRKNLQRLIETQLPSFIKALLRQLGAVADQENLRAFLVGGFVRDLLLRQENLDIDIVVEGDGIAFARAFAAVAQCRVREHEKFGTAVIVLPDGFKIDVASARLEYYASPAALPNVEHASIRHDLYRRDFTINTLTVSLNKDNYGQMLDFFGGQRDIKDKSIRVLHNLSFIEDPTRLFRAIRFEQRLGFRIGRQTERFMRSAVRMKLVKKVGGARIMNELEQILDEPQVVAALERLEQFDLLQFIDIHLHFDHQTRKLLLAAERACSWFDLLYTGERYRRWLVYLLCLFDGLSEKGINRIVRSLAIHQKEHDLLLAQRSRGLALLKMVTLPRNEQQTPKNSDIYHWFTGFSLELILYLMARSEDDSLRQSISLFMTRLRNTQIILNGQDLIHLGLPPGRYFQDIFKLLLDARLNEQVYSREDEIALVSQHFQTHR